MSESAVLDQVEGGAEGVVPLVVPGALADVVERFVACASLDVGSLDSVAEVERWVREVAACRAVLDVRMAELAARAEVVGATVASGALGSSRQRRAAAR